jgi:hypothetical protein
MLISSLFVIFLLLVYIFILNSKCGIVISEINKNSIGNAGVNIRKEYYVINTQKTNLKRFNKNEVTSIIIENSCIDKLVFVKAVSKKELNSLNQHETLLISNKILRPKSKLKIDLNQYVKLESRVDEFILSLEFVCYRHNTLPSINIMGVKFVMN